MNELLLIVLSLTRPASSRPLSLDGVELPLGYRT